jgi:hypothetical protein
MNDVLKAISMWQPWASLWLSQNKPYETRHWRTTHRGRLLVHATKKLVRDVDPILSRVLKNEFGSHWNTDLPTGAIIGMVDLIDVISVETIFMKGLGAEQLACGDFSEGRFGWRRGSYWRFSKPIPYRGHQTLFNVPLVMVAKQIAASREMKG